MLSAPFAALGAFFVLIAKPTTRVVGCFRALLRSFWFLRLITTSVDV
jgi:hypothetical protein